jgi:hypothetical protein
MPNGISYNTGSTPSTCLRKGNFLIANNTADYGGSFYSGIVPPISGGYTIYQNKASQGPSIYVASNNTQLINFTNHIANSTYTSATQCLTYFATQTDKMVFNIDYPPIVTSGLTLNIDAGFTPSYPTSGVTWYDISASANTGTLVNGPTYSTSKGGSIVFDGVDDYVSFPSTFNATTAGLNGYHSVEMWIYPYRVNQQNDGLFQCLNFLGTDGYLHYLIRNSKFYLGWYAVDVQGVQTITTNTWYNVVFMFDTDNRQKIYVNGVLDAQGSPLGFTFSGATAPISIGVYATYFQGLIPMCRVYNKALTSSEVLTNYQAMLPRFVGENIVTNGLVGYWDAGYSTSYIGTGTTWNNVAGTSGKTGTLVNGPTYSSANGGSILFDGVDDYGFISANNGFQPSNELTLEVWFKSSGNNGKVQGLLYLNYGTGLRLNPTGTIHSRINSMGFLQQFETTSTYFNSQWNQALLTINSTNATLYVNSNFVETYSIVYDGSSPYNTGIGGIGTDINDSANRGFNGNISIGRVYNRTLSTTEIQQNYNAQKSRYGL